MTDKWIEFFVIIGLVFLLAWILIYFTDIRPERKRKEAESKFLESKECPEYAKMSSEIFLQKEFEKYGKYSEVWKANRDTFTKWMTWGDLAVVCMGIVDEMVELLEKGKQHD